MTNYLFTISGVCTLCLFLYHSLKYVYSKHVCRIARKRAQKEVEEYKRKQENHRLGYVVFGDMRDAHVRGADLRGANFSEGSPI